MSKGSSQQRKIAQEIIDQTLNQFKKQREGAYEKQPQSSTPVVNQPLERYEPSAGFHKVFSEVIGGKEKVARKADGILKPNSKSPLNVVPTQIKEEPKQIVSSNEKNDLPQAAVEKPVESEPQKEIVVKPAQPSVFERLARLANVEDANQEQKAEKAEDTSQVSNAANNQEKKANSTPPASVFQKLSRNASSN